MKNSILIAFGFMIIISNAQTPAPSKFELSFESGFTDYIVLETKDIGIKDEYSRTLDWIAKAYNTPKEVIKATVENDYVRIQGVSKDLFVQNVLGRKMSNDVRYQIEIQFKEGRVKFDVLELEIYSEGSQYSAPGWYPLDAKESLYKKDGKQRAQTKPGWENIVNNFNTLGLSLKEYILNPSTSVKDDW